MCLPQREHFQGINFDSVVAKDYDDEKIKLGENFIFDKDNFGPLLLLIIH